MLNYKFIYKNKHHLVNSIQNKIRQKTNNLSFKLEKSSTDCLHTLFFMEVKGGYELFNHGYKNPMYILNFMINQNIELLVDAEKQTDVFYEIIEKCKKEYYKYKQKTK